MSVNKKMTNLADAIRAKSGATGKLSIDRMTTAVNGLFIGVNTSDATARAQYILEGLTAYAKGEKITGTLPRKDYSSITLTPSNPGLLDIEPFYSEVLAVSVAVTSVTVTPGKDTQSIQDPDKFYYAVTVPGDSNLIPENIVKGKTIFGVEGAADIGGGGGSGGDSADFYKCAEVFGPEKVSGFIVSGAGTAAVNGNYLPTDLKTEEDTPIYKHETAEYYYYEMWGEKGITTSPTQYPSEGLYYNMYGEGWTVRSGGAEPVPTVTAGNITINADVPKTWNGYKAVWSEENGYAFEETLSSNLAYGKGFTPDINSIYNSDATVLVGKLYVNTHKRSVLTIVARDSGIAGVYKQVEGTEYGTKNCRWNYTNGDYPSRNIHWGTPTVGGSYGDDDYVGVEGWHVFDGEVENKVWLGDGVSPVAPTHWDSSSVLTESFEDWE